jgi:hypothetical protein
MSSPYARRVRKFVQPFRMTQNRVAWCSTHMGTFAMYFYNDPEEAQKSDEGEDVQPTVITEAGPTIRLSIIRPRRGKPMLLDLTAVTEKELDYIQEIINLACDTARPITRLRDQEAQDAAAIGDYSYTRLYRPIPQLVIRAREGVKYLESLRDRFEGLPGGSPGDRNPGELRIPGDEVAATEPGASESEDDEQKVD